MTVDPVEVADGDSWKVHLCLVTHVCTCHNRVFPKVDHNLIIRLCFSLLFYNLKSEIHQHNVLYSQSSKADEDDPPIEKQHKWKHSMQCWTTHHINALPRLLALDALLMPEIEVSVPKLKIRFFISKRLKCCRRCYTNTSNAGSRSSKTKQEVTKQNILFVYQGCFSEM